jgi:hypothetical protein
LQNVDPTKARRDDVDGLIGISYSVIASASEAIQGRKQSWIASAFAKRLWRTGRRKGSSQ